MRTQYSRCTREDKHRSALRQQVSRRGAAPPLCFSTSGSTFFQYPGLWAVRGECGRSVRAHGHGQAQCTVTAVVNATTAWACVPRCVVCALCLRTDLIAAATFLWRFSFRSSLLIATVDSVYTTAPHRQLDRQVIHTAGNPPHGRTVFITHGTTRVARRADRELLCTPYVWP